MVDLTEQGYTKTEFSAQAGQHVIRHPVYEKGDGPTVVLIQELPGIGPETLRLADKLLNAGHRVVMPHLFGPIGKISMVGNLVRVFCMRKEFSLFSANRTSPIVAWLRALCNDVKNRHQVKGVGVIGMCLTGNFAISLIADDSVLAAVASQPAMPINKQDALHMSESDIEEIKAAIDRKGPMKAYRFEKDTMPSPVKFECIHETFNPDKERIQCKTLPGKGHSVLTLHFVDEVGHPTHDALSEVIEYFQAQLA